MTKSKIISFCMATLLAFTLPTTVYASSTPFTDISDVGAKDMILSLQEEGYVKGIGDNLFAPNRSMTIAEGVQLIVNTLQLNIDTICFVKKPQATDFFTKADNNAWYADAFIIAACNDLALPRDLDPNAVWTRQEFTNQLVTAMEQYGNLPKMKMIGVTITDQENIDVSCSGAIQRALVYNVVTLDAQGNFHPLDPVTRAEAAEMIFHALECLGS